MTLNTEDEVGLDWAEELGDIQSKMFFCFGATALGWYTSCWFEGQENGLLLIIGGGVATLLEILLIVLACDVQEDTAKQIKYS